jgi:hypothetical protein
MTGKPSLATLRHRIIANRPMCEHCGAKKEHWSALCEECMRFGTPRANLASFLGVELNSPC